MTVSPETDEPIRGDAEDNRERSASVLARVTNRIAPFGVVLVLILLIAGYSVSLPRTFPTSGNLNAIVTSQEVLLILAVAVTIPLRAGDFDLSIASVMVFAASVLAVLTTHGVHPLAAAALVLAVGMLIGAVNGALVVILRLDAFVSTLASMTILGGLALAVTQTQVISGLPESVVAFSRHRILGLPQGAYFGWLLVFVLWYVYEQTPLGRYLLVIGEAREAGRLSGLPVSEIRFGAFVASAGLSAFAGIVLAGSLGAVDPSIGPQFLLQPYAAAFLGATTVRLGQFNVLGTLVALYLLIVGVTGLQLIGVDAWVGEVFNGAALLVGIIVARFVSREAQS